MVGFVPCFQDTVQRAEPESYTKLKKYGHSTSRTEDTKETFLCSGSKLIVPVMNETGKAKGDERGTWTKKDRQAFHPHLIVDPAIRMVMQANPVIRMVMQKKKSCDTDGKQTGSSPFKERQRNDVGSNGNNDNVTKKRHFSAVIFLSASATRQAVAMNVKYARPFVPIRTRKATTQKKTGNIIHISRHDPSCRRRPFAERGEETPCSQKVNQIEISKRDEAKAQESDQNPDQRNHLCSTTQRCRLDRVSCRKGWWDSLEASQINVQKKEPYQDAQLKFFRLRRHGNLEVGSTSRCATSAGGWEYIIDSEASLLMMGQKPEREEDRYKFGHS